ncbi:MAG: hypothetical protein GY861_03370 [bacterium]|nr:hypothetical protein [bacterium]
MTGWIKLHRSFTEWEWYDQPNMVWLFIKCLLLANHEDKKWHGIDIRRGSFITSYENLSSKKAKVSVQQIRTALKRLKSTGEITIKTTNQYTHISIINYDKHQSFNKQINKQITNEQQTNNKQITTTKEYKNDKNVKKKEVPRPKEEDFERIASKYKVPLSFVLSKWDDLQTYCRAKGKTYKNYNAALSQWVKRDAIKIRKEHGEKSKIRFINPS